MKKKRKNVMNNIKNSRVSQSSDDGYSSDGVNKTPEKEEVRILRQDKEFRERYIVESILNNSANGVIYTGKYY